MSQKQGYILLPDEVARRCDLTAADKIVLCQLARLQGKKACCYPSYAYLAEKCGLSERQAMRVVANLVGLKEIIKLPHKQRPNTYSVPWATLRNVRRVWAERRAKAAVA